MNELELNPVKRLLIDVADQAGPLEASSDRIVSLARRRRQVRAGGVGVAIGCLAVGVALTVPFGGGASPRGSGGASSLQPAGVRTGGPNCDSTPPSPPSSNRPYLGDFRSCQYLGLTLEAARVQAAREHRDLVVISRDGVHFGMTLERRASRVSVDVVDDHVIRAIIG